MYMFVHAMFYAYDTYTSPHDIYMSYTLMLTLPLLHRYPYTAIGRAADWIIGHVLAGRHR